MSDVRFPMRPLSDLVTAIRDGTHGTHQRVTEGVPLLSAKNITTNGEIAVDETDDLISEVDYQDLTRSFQLEPDDLLLTIVGSLGRRAIYSGQRVTFQRSVAYIRPQQRKINSKFLFHWMGHPAFSKELARRSNATAQSGLYLGELAKISVPAPNELEQSEIAQVLDTLDTAIYETEALIDKLKAVKKGLLHDLLTRGIDANGQLRPPQSQAPQLYKESPLGWIPREWVIDVIEDFLERIIDYRGKTPAKTASGVPLLTAKNVRLGYVAPEPREFIANESFERWMSRGIPRKGDVLFTTEAPLGNVAQIETDDRLAFAQRMIILQASSRIVDSFLKYLMLGQHFRSRLFALGSGSTVEGIQQSTLRKMIIAIPESLAEQNSIVEMLIEMDSKISNESTCMEKLRQAKSGLMDDLLTGRVRVTPLLQSMQQPAAPTGA